MKKSTIIILLLLTAILNGCFLVPQNQIQKTKTPEKVACAQDAKICPDGTAVSRAGSDCQFAPCPETPEKELKWQKINASNVDPVPPIFSFIAQIPANWRLEAVPQIEAINIYNPDSTGANNLEKSQIFIRYFQASGFLTLSTVTIHNQTKTAVLGRPAVVYDIEKKSGIADFANQPGWRSQRHAVTDIRLSDSNPSIFYVIAKRPDLDQAIFNQFLNSLEFNVSAETSVTLPTKDATGRITKKPFGIYITPQNSPVQPEKFTGYHTGADFEYADAPEAVPVFAVADGEVVHSGWVNGYGGMIAIAHQIKGKTYTTIYGHLDPDNLVSAGQTVKKGQQIGHLGEGNTNETDGERKHLHLAFYNGASLNLKGYVSDQSDLKSWTDPAELLDID
ncbi:M23 family metallopeptidase [Candidatus Falkowbacteria bacterium]|nr:M23 family metallopeptidase [Candidatus Falkowbacteria bacterium]